MPNKELVQSSQVFVYWCN